MSEAIIRNHREGILAIDIKNGNMQGDPDGDNRSRTDPETSHGLMTAAGVKRKIRDLLALKGHALYIARGACLERQNLGAAASVGQAELFEDAGSEEDGESEEGEETAESRKPKAAASKGKAKGKKTKPNPESSRLVFDALAEKFIDFRIFGGTVPRLVGTGRGPVQFSFGESVDPVTPIRMAITRVAVATEKEAEAQDGANRGMGGQWYVPYGLYRFHWFISPSDAARTKMTERDYDLFVWAMQHLFDNDRSSVRTSTAVRLLYEFHHKETLPGSLSGERLLERVRIIRRDPSKPARSFKDYVVDVHASVLRCPDVELRKTIDDSVEPDEKAAE